MLSHLYELFIWVLSTSAMASILVLFIFLAKFFLKDQLNPKWTYLLWILLLFRLMLPWTPESSFSIFNILSVEKLELIGESNSIDLQGSPVVKESRNQIPLLTEKATEPAAPILETRTTEDEKIPFKYILSIIWLMGFVLMLTIFITVNMRLAFKVKKEPEIKNQNIQSIFQKCKREMGARQRVVLIESEQVSTPTLFGVIVPKLLLPRFVQNALTEDQLKYMFLHELSHVKRKDILMNWMMSMLLTLHWFNPLLWFAFIKMREDQEVACDSLALTHIDPKESREYALTIIKLLESISSPLHLASTAKISGNKNGLKRRMTMIMSFKKNSKRWSIVGMTVILLISGCTLTNSKSNSNLEREDNGLAVELDGSEIPLPGAEGVKVFGTVNEIGDMFHEIIIQTKDKQKAFSWENVTNPSYYPVSHIADVDTDGKEEIIIILTLGYGTSVNLQEIHVLNMEDLSEIEVENPLEAIKEKVTSDITKEDGKVHIVIESNGTKVERTYDESDVGAWNEEISFGSIVHYLLSDNNITAMVPGAVSPSEFPVTVEVEYGSDLKVKNIKLVDEKVVELATVWATALQTRDGKPRYEMMSQRIKEKFEQEQMSRSGENWNFSIGVSSPWVVDFDILIDSRSAMITYVTQTSEPAFYHTREIITFTMEKGKLVVDVYETVFEDVLIEEKELESYFENNGSLVPKDKATEIFNQIEGPVELNDKLLNKDDEMLVEAFTSIQHWTNDVIVSLLNDGFYIVNDEVRAQKVQKLQDSFTESMAETIASQFYAKIRNGGFYHFLEQEAYGGHLPFIKEIEDVNIQNKNGETEVEITGSYVELNDKVTVTTKISLIKENGIFLINKWETEGQVP